MNIEFVREEFEKILVLEERAKAFYDHYIDQVDNKDIRDQLVSIRDDEVRHIGVARKLIEHAK